MATTPGTYIRDLLLGTLIFFVIVTGTTAYLQSELILVKKYDAYVHWWVVLLLVPAVAGIVLRLKRIISPLFSCMFGALASTALLYVLYKSWWATPPRLIDAAIYLAVVFGIGYFATQPLKSTFMLAFKLGRFSGSGGKGKAATRTQRMAKQSTTQPIYSNHGSSIALLELLVGICSLVLSVFSVFYLGRG